MNLILPKLPEQFIEAINKVAELLDVADNHVFVGGGCIRDLILGVPYRDIDIGVVGGLRYISDENLKNIEENYTVDNRASQKDDNDRVTPAWRAVIKVPNTKTLQENVDLYIVEDSTLSIPDVIESFDIGLCKIAYTQGMWFIHEQFIEDFNEQVIRVRNTGCSSKESTIVRLEKFQQKFKHLGFTVDDSMLDYFWHGLDSSEI